MDNEEAIRKLEEQFPAMSGVAFGEAGKRALDSGLRILQTEHDAIYEYFPDGTRRFVKWIEPSTPSYPGTTVTIAPAKK